MTKFKEIKQWFFLEKIVSKPLIASMLVGSSIIGMNAFARWFFEDTNFFTDLMFSWQINPLLFFSKMGPPFLVPLLITSIARKMQLKINELRFMENAIPSMFLVIIPKDKLNQISQQNVYKVNTSYRLYFPLLNTNLDQETILPERFWKHSTQRESFFMELTQNKSIQGQEADFVTDHGNEWQGLIYMRCIELKNDYKVQGLVIRWKESS